MCSRIDPACQGSERFWGGKPAASASVLVLLSRVNSLKPMSIERSRERSTVCSIVTRPRRNDDDIPLLAMASVSVPQAKNLSGGSDLYGGLGGGNSLCHQARRPRHWRTSGLGSNRSRR